MYQLDRWKIKNNYLFIYLTKKEILLLTYDSEGKPNTGQGQNSRPHFYCQEAQIRPQALLYSLKHKMKFWTKVLKKLIIVFCVSDKGINLHKEIKTDRSTENSCQLMAVVRNWNTLLSFFLIADHGWNAEDQNILIIPPSFRGIITTPATSVADWNYVRCWCWLYMLLCSSNSYL